MNFTTATDDVTTTGTLEVERAMRAYERILGYALSKPDTLDFVRQQEEQWKSQI